jgi:hypothetical protein
VQAALGLAEAAEGAWRRKSASGTDQGTERDWSGWRTECGGRPGDRAGRRGRGQPGAGGSARRSAGGGACRWRKMAAPGGSAWRQRVAAVACEISSETACEWAGVGVVYSPTSGGPRIFGGPWGKIVENVLTFSASSNFCGPRGKTTKNSLFFDSPRWTDENSLNFHAARG